MALNTNTRIASGRHEVRTANESPPAYQVMPDLSEEDYSALKADIAQNGVLVPVEYDDEGNVLDGHHRLRACAELGIKKWPKIVRRNMTEEGKRTHARQLNLARRHLDRAQKRELITAQLKDTPEKSNRQVADGLGVDHKTVQSVRSEAERRGEIPHVSERTDAAGRQQPAQKEPPKPRPEREKRGGLRHVLDPEFQAEAEAAAREMEFERDERIALSGTGHLVEENEGLRKRVALQDRRIASLTDDLRSCQYREKMWKERALAAGWKARADA